MYSVIVDVKDPVLNIIKVHKDDRCLILQAKSGNDVLGIHFEDKEQLDAFIGLLQIARGQVK